MPTEGFYYYGYPLTEWEKERAKLAKMTFHERKAYRIAKQRRAEQPHGSRESDNG